MGIYRHYKGPLYQVLGLAHDANDDKRLAVIYIGLQLDAAHLGPRLSVRTFRDFIGTVCNNINCAAYGQFVLPELVHNKGTCTSSIKRFTYLGSELTAEMLS